ncbi:unnamed protein product, partial [Meganyctiphanes norvegica]
KSLDNDVDEKLEEVTESTVNFDEIPQKANNANENFAKILDNDTVEKLAEPIVSLDEVTPKNIVANEKVAKSLDTVAVDVLAEVTTINIPTVSTIKHTTAPFEFSSSTAPPTIAPAVGHPKALSFIEPEEVATADESIKNEVFEILRGNLIYALINNATDGFRIK